MDEEAKSSAFSEDYSVVLFCFLMSLEIQEVLADLNILL